MEELRSQLGDRLPSAVPLMAKAAQDAGLTINGTVAELNDLMQKGKVYSDKILPYFAKRLREFANANGALEAKLKSNRVAMNRMISVYQMAAVDFFQSGYGDGLTDFFNVLADEIAQLNPLFRSFSAILGSLLKGIAVAIKFITIPFKVFGSVLEKVTDIAGKFSYIVVPAFYMFTLWATRAIPIIGTLSTVIMTKLLPALWSIVANPITLGIIGLLILLDEIRAWFDDDVQGAFESGGWLQLFSDDDVAGIKQRFNAFVSWLNDIGNQIRNSSLYIVIQSIVDNLKYTFDKLSALKNMVGLGAPTVDTRNTNTVAGAGYPGMGGGQNFNGPISIQVTSPDANQAGQNIMDALNKFVR